MTAAKKQSNLKIAEPAKQPATQSGAEVSETDLNKAAGGALNAYTPAPTESAHSSGGGGGAGKPAMGDGSVRTNNSLIGLL
jgi:hypothetical protein